ncbi:hypothetical protein SMALA_1365 [Streptomyces malaysiensis subsp. malaysiensis]|nr:hypothetical protein SMALA_1365 [Streptomyces malaysiensis]
MLAKHVSAVQAARGAAIAVQVMASAGARDGHVVARAYRDAKLMEIIEGSNEMCELMLAQHALGGRLPLRRLRGVPPLLRRGPGRRRPGRRAAPSRGRSETGADHDAPGDLRRVTNVPRGCDDIGCHSPEARVGQAPFTAARVTPSANTKSKLAGPRSASSSQRTAAASSTSGSPGRTGCDSRGPRMLSRST